MNPQECYNIEYSNKTMMSGMVDEYQYWHYGGTCCLHLQGQPCRKR